MADKRTKAVDIRSSYDKKYDKTSAPVLATFEQVDKDWLGKPTYRVTVDGKSIGFVRRTERTWERRPSGSRIVSARGQVVGWVIGYDTRPSATGYKYDTRNEAARALLANWENAQGKEV